MIRVSVDVDHDSLSVEASVVERCVQVVLTAEGVAAADVGVVLTDHVSVRSLNKAYLGHDYVTDVLSFNLTDEEETGLLEGEVYVDLETAFERCTEFDVPFEHEVCRYLIHGLLHLAGHRDDTPFGKTAMRQLENRYLVLVEVAGT